MSEETHIWQQISDYLDGSMGQEDRIAFKEKLASNPELATFIEADRLAFEVVIGYEALKLKDQMKKDLAKPKSYKIYWLGLPLLAFLLGSIYWQYSSSSDKPVHRGVIKKSEVNAEVKYPGLTNSTVPGKSGSVTKSIVQTKVSDQRPFLNSTKPEELPHHSSNLIQISETKARIVLPDSFKKEPSATNPCLNLDLATKYTITPSCSNESTGELDIKQGSIKSGLPPYSFSLDGNEYHSERFSFLRSGKYTLHVKDGNNCISKQEIVISSVRCGQTNEYSYHPAYDQVWTIPYNDNKKATLFRITDKGGQDIYRVTVSDGSPAQWHGESNTGLAVSVGLHLFFIEYSDGSVDKGAITILQ